jgi:hypothetical protein
VVGIDEEPLAITHASTTITFAHTTRHTTRMTHTTCQ